MKAVFFGEIKKVNSFIFLCAAFFNENEQIKDIHSINFTDM